MAMDPCNVNMSWATCKTCYQDRYDVRLQNAMDSSKPWIGMYIAAASAICGIATTFDVFNGFKTKQIWFPCKYFSLNATSLTLLAIAMKLTMDLTSTKLGDNDTIAGYSSVVLMSTAMGNFVTSLASMDNNDMMINLTALGILVITVVVNVWLFDFQLGKFYVGGPYFDDFVCGFLLLLFIMLCTSAIIAPTVKRYIETKFCEMHEMVLNERVPGAKFTAEELTVILRKYWVMAGTGNPQFVMARTVICVIPGVVCLPLTLTLLVLMFFEDNEQDGNFFHSDSIYKWSINCILIIQILGSVIGTIATTSRLFVAIRFRSSRAGRRSFEEELKIETYWTKRLIEWRERRMPVRIRHVKSKKILHISKKVLLDICILIQLVIVLYSKTILIIILWFINLLSKFRSDRREHDSRASGTDESDLNLYALLLEGELKLPNKTLAIISNEGDKLIQVGKRRKPKNIIELLQNSVRNFDKKNITIFNVQEPRTCWSLFVVTLTSIALAFPNISSTKLFSWVSEGLPFVNYVEKHFDTSGELKNIRETTDIIWERLELDQKSKDKDDVQRNGMNDQTYKNTFFKLSTEAKETVMSFRNSTTDSVTNNPLNWPTKIIAANTMYMACESLLLLENDGTENQTDGQIFERLSMIISDILAACLTNLAHVIFTECHINSVEKRQQSTRRALILLGESEEIIQCLEQREWPNLDPHKAGFIEEWRAVLDLGREDPVISVSTTDNRPVQQSSNGQVIVNLGSSC